jgi:hypothetical protein
MNMGVGDLLQLTLHVAYAYTPSCTFMSTMDDMLLSVGDVNDKQSLCQQKYGIGLAVLLAESAMTVALVNFERYYQNIKQGNLSLLQRGLCILLTWVLAIILGVIPLFLDTRYRPLGGFSTYVELPWDTIHPSVPFVSLLLMSTDIMKAYYFQHLILANYYNVNKRIAALTDLPEQVKQNEKRAYWKHIAHITSLTICWIPYLVVLCCKSLGVWNRVVDQIAHTLLYSFTMTNLILYYLLDKRLQNCVAEKWPRSTLTTADSNLPRRPRVTTDDL